MKRLVLKNSLLSGCVLAGLVLSCPANAETLQEAVLSALNTHPGVDVAIAAREAATEGRRAAYSAYFPELSASAATGRMYGDNATSRGLTFDRGAGYSWLHEGNLSLSQMLFDGYEARNAVDAAAARRMAAESAINDVREQLAYQTVLAYLSVLRAAEEHALISDYADKTDDYIERIKIMVEGGAAGEGELQQASDMRLLLENIRLESEGRLDVARVRYAELVGAYPEGPLQAPPFNEDMIPAIEEAVARSAAMHPSLQTQESRAAAAENEIGREQSALYPDFNAELSYYKKDLADDIGGEVTDAKGLVRMSWNFSTGGAQLSTIRKRRHEYAGAQARLRELRREIEKNVRTAYAELETAGALHETYARRAALMDELAATNRTRFEGGMAGLLELLQSENQLFSARMDLIGAHYRLWAARYGVPSATGTLQSVLRIVPAPDIEGETDQQGQAIAYTGGD
jgi:adhesin transport system outer membrane protein